MRQTLSYLKNKLGLGEPEHVVETFHHAEGEARENVSLTDTTEWQRLANLWSRAEKVEVSGAPDADLRVTIGSLETTARDIDRLMSTGLLSGAEADLLHLELDARVMRLEEAMNTPRSNASGQSMRPSHPARGARQRLADRQGPLEQLSAAPRLNTHVLKLVLPQVEQDVELLTRDDITQSLQPTELGKVRRVRENCRTALERIRTRLRGGASSARATSEWHEIRSAWRELAPLAERKPSPVERRRAESRLAGAREAALRLRLSGLMSRPEMSLFMQKADELQKRIRHNATASAGGRMSA
jgi:hypothetical protein